MSVPAFVKKKHKVVDWSYQNLIKNAIIYCQIFKYVGANANQIAKYCNQHQYEVPNYKALEYNIHKLRERLDDIWQRLR